MTHDFVFELPTRVEFGSGAVSRIGGRVTELGGSRILLVTDPGLLAAGVADRVLEALDDAKLEYVLFTEFEADPDVTSVEAGTKLFEAEGCDIVVGVGGGSSLDTGKAIALMARNSGHIRDYVGQGVATVQGAPVIAVPTTAGTGSEATVWAVISERAKQVKYGVGGPHLTADLALCDPTLSASLPTHLTAVTGLDALAHALESYVNKATHPISEGLSEKAMELVSRSLRNAVWGGDQIDARADMLLASTIAAMAFNSTRLGLAHALAMPLGARAKIPHGDVIAVLLPEVVKFNVVGNLDKFARIARIFGEHTEGMSLRAAADAGVAAVEQLVSDVGAPRSLGDYGVIEADLAVMAEEAMQSGNVAVNPRQATPGDLVGVMRRCL